MKDLRACELSQGPRGMCPLLGQVLDGGGGKGHLAGVSALAVEDTPGLSEKQFKL